MSIAVCDVVIVLIYMLFIAIIGIVSQKKVSNTDDYYIAGRSLPPFVLLATVSASVIGGSALIGKGGYAYTGGMVCVAIGLPYMLGMFIFSAFCGKISKLGKKYKFTSMSEMLGYRFGPTVKIISAALVIYTSIATVGAQISATGTILSTIGGENVNYLLGALVATIIFTVYTASSGLFGVVYTDVVQFVVLILFVYIMLPIFSIREVGGFAALINQTPVEKWELHLTPDIMTLIFTNFVMTIAGTEFWQRAFAAKDGKAAFRGQFWGTSVYAVTIVITMFIGLSAAILYPNLVKDYGSADYTIPVLIVKTLPVGLVGLALAGVISVMMSSADTYLLCATQSFVSDIVKYFIPTIDSDKSLLLSRIATILFSVFAFVIAMFHHNAYDALMFGWVFYAATLGIPCLATLIWKKATKYGIICGMASGFITSIAWKIMGNPFNFGTTLAGVIANAAVLIIVSLITYKKYPSKFVTIDTE